MDDSIKKNNKIPGSEKLTRPEEISALSKYLGKIHKIQDEHTKLDLTELEVPGKTTGLLPDINTLPDNTIDLDVKNNISLDNTLINLDTNNKINLENKKEELKNVNKDISLGNSKENLLKDNSDIVNLDSRVININDINEDIELDKKKIDLNNSSDNVNKLDNNISKLIDENNDELKELVKDNIKLGKKQTNDINLDKTIKSITNDKEINLKNSKSKLITEDQKTDLEDKILNLNIRDEIKPLNNSNLKLTVKSSIKELSDKVLNLNIEDSNTTLIDSSIDLVNNENKSNEPDSLVNFIDNITSNIDKNTDHSYWDNNNLDNQTLYESALEAPLDDNSNNYFNNNIELDQTLPEVINEIPNNIDENDHNYWNNQVNTGEENLYDSNLKKPEDNSTDSEHNYFNNFSKENQQLYDNRLSLSEDQKYEKALEFAGTTGQWGLKIASLVSAYLGNTNITKAKADEFEEKLKEAISIDLKGYLDSIIDSDKRNGATGKNKYVDLSALSSDNSDTDKNLDTSSLSNFEFTELLNNQLTKSDNGSSIKRPISESIEGNKLENLGTGNSIDSDGNSNTTALSNFEFNNPNLNKKNSRKKSSNNTIKLPDQDSQKGGTFTGGIADDRDQEVMFGFGTTGASSDDYGYPESIPSYKLPGMESGGYAINMNNYNINNYLRWAAENTIGLWKPKNQSERKIRNLLLDETLSLLVLAREQLEKLTKANRDRLPGNDLGLISDLITGGVSGAAKSLTNTLLDSAIDIMSGKGGVNTKNPINRPKADMYGNKKLTQGFKKANSRIDVHSGETVSKSIGKYLGSSLKSSLLGIMGGSEKTDYDFFENYIKSYGMFTTLDELCNIDSNWCGSVEELYDFLKRSPYITTPYKFGTIETGSYGSMTLDTNNYWEIVMTPLCDDLNNNFSYLPAISEINLINKIQHGVSTYYSKWVPFNSFELQKSKMSTKSLGLFDGEINYPISSELINELRVTIVDDQYKSWKNYFQKCADVAVYNSEVHDMKWYGEDRFNYYIKKNGITWEYHNLTKTQAEQKAPSYEKGEQTGGALHPTVVDKTIPLVAFYKNITFEIKIYSMTPQYSTIRKYDLLCVLRDFTEEYSGDIDASNNDLNITFSIVGEKTTDSSSGVINSSSISKDKKTLKERTKELTNKGNSNLIKLL